MLWNKRISTIRSTAFRRLCFLRRKLKHSMRDVKLTAYQAYIRLILEYGSVVWTPFTKKNADSLEKVQRQAARFICSNYRQTASVTDMLNSCGLEPLTVRRQRARLKFFYLIYNKELNINIESYAQALTSKRSARLNHSKSVQSYYSRIDIFKHSFFVETIEMWNRLPQDVVDATSVVAFENALRLYFC